jgi:3-phenylpropionate/trans-cinnamate dioxygenase ferredoxin subunit
MAKHVVLKVAEVSEGGRRRVEIEGRRIVLFNLKGEFFALLDRCPHEGGSLCDGKLTGLVESDSPGDYRYSREGEIIRCPWHSWEFDIRTGKSWCDPRRIRVKNYPVSIHDGASLVEGPYTAQTFPVSVEDSYIVVDM